VVSAWLCCWLPDPAGNSPFVLILALLGGPEVLALIYSKQQQQLQQ
jgi:hypothetical protein